MPNNSTPYPQEFTTPEIVDGCPDCTVLVGKWARHMKRRTTTGEPNKDYDPSAASDAAVLWKMHVANTHAGSR
jgi:hypothetical protein